jgi:hypothetical protein
MTSGSNPVLALSASTARKIDWDFLAAELHSSGLDSSRGEKELLQGEDYGKRVLSVFEGAKREFARALQPLRRQVQVTLWILLPALAITIAAGAALAVYWSAIGGVALSAASFAGFFALLLKSWRLGRDQANLELIPASYEVLFALCKTNEQFKVVFDAFLTEMIEMRKNLRLKSE